MSDITQLPVMTATDAQSCGFARFNDVPTLPVDVRDGGFTISAKTTEGRRLTIYFGANTHGGPARFVDIQYHDKGTTIANADRGRSPTFDFIGIGRGGKFVADTRRLDDPAKPSILCVFMDTKDDTD